MINFNLLNFIKTEVYDPCKLVISNFTISKESKEYQACSFCLNGNSVICRTGKITPKKIGQFVTFWKRNDQGITVPFHKTDDFDFYVINVKNESKIGQFIFPKNALIKYGILSTNKKEGKRGFRLYPSWDTPNNKQAMKTQKWQLVYFIEMNSVTDFEKVKQQYKKH